MPSRLRTTAVLTAVLAVGTAVLTGCSNGPSADAEFATYVHDHRLVGGSVLRSRLIDDDGCDCTSLQVTLSVDGADQIMAEPELVARNLASVMEGVCSFKTSSPVRRSWLISQLGPWSRAEAGLVIGAPQPGLSPHCRPADVEAASTTLVDSIRAAGSVPGMSPQEEDADFTSYVLDERSEVTAAAEALRNLTKYADPTLVVKDDWGNVVLESDVLRNDQLVDQIGRLFHQVPAGVRLRSRQLSLSCSDCDGLPDLPDPALAITAENQEELIPQWAAASGVDTEPHDGRIVLLPAAAQAGGSLTYTSAQLEQLH